LEEQQVHPQAPALADGSRRIPQSIGEKNMETSDKSKPAHGMCTFFTIWFGQLVSLLGSQLTGFGMGEVGRAEAALGATTIL
jgi:hypothetical protein